MKSNLITIPGLGTFNVKNVFIDYNGTIAEDGQLLPGIINELSRLSEYYNVYVITGDTFGSVKAAFKGTAVQVIIADTANEKLAVIEQHEPDNSIAIGNGSIDYKMFMAAKLSFCIIGTEGASVKAIQQADIVVQNVHHVFEMLHQPNKIIATLKE